MPGKSVNYRVTGAVEQGDRARVRVEVLDEPDVEELREVGRRPQELILEELVQEGVGLRRVICSPPEPQTASSRLAPCSGGALLVGSQRDRKNNALHPRRRLHNRAPISAGEVSRASP